MTTQPTPATTNAKPSLQGVRLKTRKRVQTATAKFEPEAFRDQLFTVLNSIDVSDYDAVAQKLDQTGNTLDYRKYGETLFELVVTGGILAPGGSFLDDGAPPSPFSVFAAKSENPQDVKRVCDVINKLIRRYKFLQLTLEESLKNNILPHIKAWTKDQSQKVATAVGFWTSSGLVNINVLTALTKENLVKDGHALDFVTSVFKTYCHDHDIEHLGVALKRGGIKDIMDFFPPNKATETHFREHFKAQGLPQIVDYRVKKQMNSYREETREKLTEMVEAGEKPAEIVAYLKEQLKVMQMPEGEFVGLIWEGIMKSVDWSSRPDQLEAQALKTVNQWAPVLAAFTSNSKTELALVQKVQTYTFEEAKLMKFFRQIIQVLYKHDVISEGAIMYWYSKGAKPQGKNHFLNAMEPFIKILKEAESDEEDEDEDDE